MRVHQTFSCSWMASNSRKKDATVFQKLLGSPALQTSSVNCLVVWDGVIDLLLMCTSSTLALAAL